MNIAIVDYRSGNLHSALKSFQAAASNFKNVNVKITSCYKDVRVADKVVLPGVGSFSFCKSKLHENTEVYKSLIDIVIEKKKPFLGICVGMQLLATTGHEGQSNNPGLNWIRGEVINIDVAQNLIIPHMGWNKINIQKKSNVFDNIPNDSWMYFVHSYKFNLNAGLTLTKSCYGEDFSSSISHENIFATQFHPEKSSFQGLKVLENFAKIAS